ncbi:MAG TPA: hypothetical protein VN131_05585, partial [Mobilitalea sp.]|nr:hypothetical protein [Mobilitalea sp.]
RAGFCFPSVQKYPRWWCAIKGMQMMKEGPSAGIVQANLPNNPNTAEVKSFGGIRLGKRLYKTVM